MIKLCRYALVTALAIFLAGCVGQRQEPAPVEEAQDAFRTRWCRLFLRSLRSRGRLNTASSQLSPRRAYVTLTGVPRCSR